MSHRRSVTEEELNWSLELITEEHVASTVTMTEEEYILEATDPRTIRVTPHQVIRLIEFSEIGETAWEDAAVRRSF